MGFVGKRTAALLAATVLTLGALSACGGETGEGGAEVDESKPESGRVVDEFEHLVADSGESIGRTKGLDYRVILYVDWEGGAWTVVDSYMIT